MANESTMASNEPLVSISCVTYNHEAFIADAIEGFLKQRTPFPVEILIHEDASTDRTAEIVRAYERAHPDKIRAICQRVNQYSQGTRMSHFNYVRARGKYIALCEGDDYWTDPLKLAKQVRALDARPDISLCFHAARRIRHGDDADVKSIGRYAEGDAIVPVKDIINKTHGMIPTASCLVRTGAIKELMRFREEVCGLRVGDVVVQIISSLPGGALYLDEEMSVYRLHVPGSWNARQAGNAKLNLQYARDRIGVMRALDAYTHGQYAKAFSHEHRRRLLKIANMAGISRQQKWALYREFGALLNMRSRLQFLAKTLLASPRR